MSRGVDGKGLCLCSGINGSHKGEKEPSNDNPPFLKQRYHLPCSTYTSTDRTEREWKKDCEKMILRGTNKQQLPPGSLRERQASAIRTKQSFSTTDPQDPNHLKFSSERRYTWTKMPVGQFRRQPCTGRRHSY